MTANAGYHLFNTGDVLTASQVQYNLQNQTIMYFASSAARTSALSGVVVEGMFSYLADTNSTEYYDGAAWQSISNPGDITGVTAGTGISGGGTSGTVTVTNSMATAIDAKGDLVVGTGADAFSRLAVGTNTYLLTADSAEATGLKWAAPAGGGGGKVLQVVQGTTSTSTSISTTTYTDTNLTASITPTLNTSKVLVLTYQAFQMSSTGSQAFNGIKLVRGSTDILSQTNPWDFGLAAGTGQTLRILWNYSYLDSPATTSSTTYKTQARVETTSNSQNITAQTDSQLSAIILLEIGA